MRSSKEETDKFENDPLNYHGNIRVNSGYQNLLATRYLQEKISTVECKKKKKKIFIHFFLYFFFYIFFKNFFFFFYIFY